MSIAPDEFDLERSRAAVAVACLQWLRCTGPTSEPGPARATPPIVADILRDPPPIAGPIQDEGPFHLPHPLWDRWLDG